MAYSNAYTIGFAAAVCGVCSIFVAGAAVSLRDKQETNKILDRYEKVLSVAGLAQTGEKLDKDRFRRGLGGEEEAYQEVARRIGQALPDVTVDGGPGVPNQGLGTGGGIGGA